MASIELLTVAISIHAPSRERLLCSVTINLPGSYFNPRSLAGATNGNAQAVSQCLHFNPRSLAGATLITFS